MDERTGDDERAAGDGPHPGGSGGGEGPERTSIRELLGIDDGQRLHHAGPLGVRRFGEPGFPGVRLVVLVSVLGLVGAGIVVLGSGARGGDAVVIVAIVVVPVLICLAVASALSPRHPIRPPVARTGERAPRGTAGGLFRRADRANQEFLEEAATVSHDDFVAWGGHRRVRARLVLVIGCLVIALAIASVRALVL